MGPRTGRLEPPIIEAISFGRVRALKLHTSGPPERLAKMSPRRRRSRKREGGMWALARCLLFRIRFPRA